MAKKIILEMTEAEFKAMVQMIEDNATMIGCAEDDFAIPTQKNLNTFQKMLTRNKIDYRVTTFNGRK
jgi:hypothetical protein